MASSTIQKPPTRLETGSSYGTVAANSYTDVSVTFAKEFNSAPNVFAQLYTTASSMNYAKIHAVVNTRTTTGATIRIFNESSVQYTPGFYWIAAGQ